MVFKLVRKTSRYLCKRDLLKVYSPRIYGLTRSPRQWGGRHLISSPTREGGPEIEPHALCYLYDNEDQLQDESSKS